MQGRARTHTRRHASSRRRRRHAPSCRYTATAHVVSARLNCTAVSRRAVARHLSPRLARTRALVSHASLAARGPAPQSRTAPSRERRRGAAAARTFAVVAPAVARVVTAHRRRRAAMPYPAVAAATLTRVATTTAHLVAAATPTRVATVTAHVVSTRLNHTVVPRRTVHISPRATVFVVTIIVVTTVAVHALQ